MMTLYDLLCIINESTVIRIYSNDQIIIATYDGRESIPEILEDYEVNDIFGDIEEKQLFAESNKKYHIIPVIGIEIDIDFDTWEALPFKEL